MLGSIGIDRVSLPAAPSSDSTGITAPINGHRAALKLRGGRLRNRKRRHPNFLATRMENADRCMKSKSPCRPPRAVFEPSVILLLACHLEQSTTQTYFTLRFQLNSTPSSVLHLNTSLFRRHSDPRHGRI